LAGQAIIVVSAHAKKMVLGVHWRVRDIGWMQL
jgi:hypothetical protein